MTKRKQTWTGYPEGKRSNRALARTDKMSVKTKTPEPINRPTVVRTWWLVDVRETRTLKIYASGPKQARNIAAQVIADLYPPEAYDGEPHIVKRFAHTVQCDEGRSMGDRR